MKRMCRLNAACPVYPPLRELAADRRKLSIYKLVTFLFLSIVGPLLHAQTATLNFNKGWKFFLGDLPAAETPAFSDLAWRTLNLPHDWSIEGAFDEKAAAKPEGGGLPTGIGWYRKAFTLPQNWGNRLTSIEFDGVYRNSQVWLNGKLIGTRPSGYSSFSYDLTPFLKKDGANLIAVKVDNSGQPNSRWYSGSGIYRNVRLVSNDKVHISKWDLRVTALTLDGDKGDSGEGSSLRKGEKRSYAFIHAPVENQSGSGKKVLMKTKILDRRGKPVASSSYTFTSISHNSVGIADGYRLLVPSPDFWSPEHPNLYTAVVELVVDGRSVGTYRVLFGFRTFSFDAEKGFTLNDHAMRIRGVCLHHDLGALGAAFNVRAAERQLELLKKMGCNAIRTAHNPPAPEFLDLCDRMGFLVMDEAFDMWVKKKTNADYHLDFKEWHQRDLEAMVKRDRNHPSVILWSIGNEIREQFDSTGVAITKELVATVKALDHTRPVTSALTETNAEKNFIYKAGALDLYGLNYNHRLYKDFPKNYPGEKLIATETTSALETRGFYDMPADSLKRWPKDGRTKFTEGNAEWAASSYDNVSAYWGSTHEETLKAFNANRHVSGIFVWTGFDYLGEPLPYPWPARSSYFGIIDLAGFPKDSYYLYQSEWTTAPVLHLLPHWNWSAGKFIDVWAYYNNADEVELFLNGKSLGIRQKRGDELHVQWQVPYAPGVLKAISRKNGKEVLTREVRTAGAPAKIELVADRKTIRANGEDLSFVTVRIVDAKGNLVPDAMNLVKFRLSGHGTIAGVDNGFQASLEPFKADYRKAYRGLCLAIVRSTEKAGTITLKAEAEGLIAQTISITSK